MPEEMPEETPQLPVSETASRPAFGESKQETQIQAPSLLKKISAQKKKILIGLGSLLAVLIIAGAVFGAYRLGQRQAQLGLQPIPAPGLVATPIPTQEVTITTDKTEYEQGETIKITLRKSLDVPVLYYYPFYYGVGDQFWGIEYLEDGKWKDAAHERGGGFQFTGENEGDACSILLYEMMQPIEMKVNSVLSQQWNQRICPFGEEKDPYKPRLVKYIGAGHYRFIFNYGVEISSEDPFKIKNEKTVYSNEFTIKEKKVSLEAKNCNFYEMPMSEEEIRECTCPEGYKKFNRLMGAYCATDSQKPCSAHTDCPEGEHCISSDRKNWFCTGQFAGCYYRNPENPEEPMLCAD